MNSSSGSSDLRSINPQDFANGYNEGVPIMPKAGEMLYHLKKQPKWAGGD